MLIDERLTVLERRVYALECRRQAATIAGTSSPVTGRGESFLIELIAARFKNHCRSIDAATAEANIRSGRFDDTLLAIFARPASGTVVPR